jgi:hypothetical protein
MGGSCGTYGRREINAGFWWGNAKKRVHVDDIRCRWEDNIKTVWENLDVWLRTGKSVTLFTFTVVNLNVCMFNTFPIIDINLIQYMNRIC